MPPWPAVPENPNMKLQDSVVLITGANRGIGLAFAEAALMRGARKVYAGARSPSSITTAGVVPVKLDVTSDQNVAAAARICTDVTLVINNAGTQVLGLHVGFVDTDLARELDVVKVSPQSVAISAFDALEAGASEVLADERARTVKRGLTAEPAIYL
jgi:NAD(P)-dependent dehydrogenase (short-subunit alcohol dehydrogenase family)